MRKSQKEMKKHMKQIKKMNEMMVF